MANKNIFNRCLKKLLIKYEDIHNIDDIYRYIFIYIAYCKNDIKDYNNNRKKLYEYYDLPLPPQGWVDYCCNKHVLF